MTVEKLCERAGLKAYTAESGGAEASGVYCCDLLSNVIGRAPAGSVWLTVISNVNVAAVAQLAGCSCAVLCEGVAPDSLLLERAAEHKINLFSSSQDIFATAVRLDKILREG